MISSEWLLANKYVPTDMQALRLAGLDEHDLLCEECAMAGDNMLCSGLRPRFSELSSNMYGVPMVVELACDKLLAKQENSSAQSSFDKLHMPRAAITEAMKRGLPEARIVDGEVSINGVLIAPRSMALTSVRLAEHLFGALIELCLSKEDVHFVYPAWWYARNEWHSLGFESIMDSAFVYVERLDAKGGPEWAREAMFTMLRQRAAMALPTLITLGPDPSGRTDFETEFIREVQTWPKANLLSA